MRKALAAAAAVTIGLCGCSVKKQAIRSLGESLSSRLSASFATDNDPELVRAAVPFSLKLVESLIAESPRDGNLLLSAAKGFTQYSYAFVQEDADETQDRAAATALRARATKLYLRARDYGMRGLELRRPNFAADLKADPKAAAARLDAKDVPLMYWTGLSWAGALSSSRDPFMLPQIPQFQALMDRALELNESFDSGALHSFFIAFEMTSPTSHGDKAARARRHFERAVALSGAHLGGPYVSYAENVMVATKNRAGFEAELKTALKIDVNADPQYRLQNLIYQRRAKWLLERTGQLFR